MTAPLGDGQDANANYQLGELLPKYLFKVSYTTQGARGVAEEGGTGRRDAAEQATESLGGSLESFYFAFGEDDAYVIADLSDNETAAAVALAVNGSGGAVLQTVVLMTPEELDAASKKRVDFRPAGGSTLAFQAQRAAANRAGGSWPGMISMTPASRAVQHEPPRLAPLMGVRVSLADFAGSLSLARAAASGRVLPRRSKP